MISNFPNPKLKQSAYQKGATDFLFRPLHPQELQFKLMWHLEISQQIRILLCSPPDKLEKLEDQIKIILPNCILIRAFTGNEAIELSKKKHPHLIFMDVMMLEISGLLACKIIRSYQPTRSIPIFLISNFKKERLKQQAYEYGATDFLFEPLSVEEIQSKLFSLLSAKSIYGTLHHSNCSKNIFSLIRFILDKKLNGTLSLQKGEKRGKIFFHQGDIRHAELDELDSQSALHQLLQWDNLEFEFQHHEVEWSRQPSLNHILSEKDWYKN